MVPQRAYSATTHLLTSHTYFFHTALEDNEEFSQYSSGTASRWVLRGMFVQHMAEDECILSKSLRTLFLSYIDSAPFDSISQIINFGQNTTVRVTSQTGLADSAALPGVVPEEKDIQQMLDLIFEGTTAVWKERTQRPPFLSPPAQAQAQAQVQAQTQYRLKAAPVGSLLETFALSLLCIRGIKGVLLSWKEFVRRLRSYTEQEKPIPGVGRKPNLGHCLLQQKLEMLNYAMTFESIVSGEDDIKKRTSSSSTSALTSSSAGASLFDYVEEDEEEEEKEKNEEPGAGWDIDDEALETLTVSDTPVPEKAEEAAAAKEPGLLICGEPLVVPALQEVGAQTEDMIADLVSMLMGVGSGREGSLMRARLQSPQVISDMQAFKAANPRAVLGDFVRWYSPADWLGGRVGGHLSERMSVPGNTWAALWEEAKPCPAAAQRPLFDKAAETAKALHYLETLRPADLLEQLITVSLAGFLGMFSAADPERQTMEGAPHIYGPCPRMRPVLDALYEAVRTSWVQARQSVTKADCEKVWRAANNVEWHAARITSLVAKLGPSCLRVADAVASTGYCSLDTFTERMSATFAVHGQDTLPPVPHIRENINTQQSKKIGSRLYALASSSERFGHEGGSSGWGRGGSSNSSSSGNGSYSDLPPGSESVRLACCTSNEFQSFVKQ